MRSFATRSQKSQKKGLDVDSNMLFSLFWSLIVSTLLAQFWWPNHDHFCVWKLCLSWKFFREGFHRPAPPPRCFEPSGGVLFLGDLVWGVEVHKMCHEKNGGSSSSNNNSKTKHKSKHTKKNKKTTEKYIMKCNYFMHFAIRCFPVRMQQTKHDFWIMGTP